MDHHGAITRANRLTRKFHSKDSGELIGKLAWEMMATDEQEQSSAAFALAMETCQNPPVVRRSIYSSSGAFRVYDIYRNVILDALGKAIGMRAVTVDVTESHKAQESAERGRLWLESVMASLSAAVIVTDSLGFIRSINPAAEKLLGWKAEELVGKVVEKALPILSYVSDDNAHPGFTMALEKSACGVATLLDREHRELLVEIGASPILDKTTGYTTGVVSVLRRLEKA
jgi:PAS domain S-box-containing protein